MIIAKYTAQDRRDLAKKGHALPDGSFPIADVEDLKSAIRNWGLGNHPDLAKKHILKRAQALGALNVIPDKWRQQAAIHTAIDSDDFLEHFGVKGMKWGVIRSRDSSGRVSGLSENDKARITQVKRDARAGKYENIAKNYDQQIRQISSQPTRNIIGQRLQANQVRELTQYRDQALKDAEAKRQGKLSDGQKKAIVGASVVAAVLVGAAVYSGVQSGEFNRLAAKGAARLGNRPLDFKKNAKFADFKDADSVFENVVKGINPNYGAPGTKVNCRRATFAYELRRRGYDVRATRTTGATGQNVQGLANAINLTPTRSTNSYSVFARAVTGKDGLGKLSNNLGLNDISGKTVGNRTLVAPADVLKTLAREPDGSRGEFSVKWLGGGGHSMAYEIFKGKPVIFDAQSGKRYDSLDSLTNGLGTVAQAGFSRLDNIDLNNDFLNRWVKNVK